MFSGHISGRVTGRDGTVSAGVDVVLDVTSGRADVRRHGGGLLVVDDLVATEEHQGVGVVGKARPQWQRRTGGSSRCTRGRDPRG